MNIAAIFLAILAVAAFIAVVEKIVFYYLENEATDEELFEKND